MSVGDRSDRVLGRLSSLVGGGAWSRRSFLVRTSVFATALAMDPKGFALTPGSALDSVCGTDAECDAPFTAFCCTINNGANLCPDETFVGGWWKADGSAFCRGAARYYVDCNGTADSHWGCRCSGSHTCDQRKVACNIFRYGNCSLAVPTEGTAVVCRVVTCTPPWKWDAACTETSFTDQITGSQSAPCLPPPWSSPLLIEWSDLGGSGGSLGAPVGPLRALDDGDGTWQEFRRGAIFDVKWLGLFAVTDPNWAVAKHHVGRAGIGYPADNVQVLPDGRGWTQDFVNLRDGRKIQVAEIVGAEAAGTHLVVIPVLSKWHALGGQGGPIGSPTTDTRQTTDALGSFNEFRKQPRHTAPYRGAIYAHPTVGTHAMHGPIYEKWRRLGGETGPLGLPASDQRAIDSFVALCAFARVDGHKIISRGAITSNERLGAWAVWGVVYERWQSSGAYRGRLGIPTSDLMTTPDGRGSYTTFVPVTGPTALTGGAIVTSPYGTWAILGSIFDTWRGNDKAGLSVPTAAEVDQVVTDVALRSQAFLGGTVYDSAVGANCNLYGPILQQYLTDGGPTGELGLPTSSVEQLQDGDEQATFQNGTLTYVPGSGVTQT